MGQSSGSISASKSRINFKLFAGKVWTTCKPPLGVKEEKINFSNSFKWSIKVPLGTR